MLIEPEPSKQGQHEIEENIGLYEGEGSQHELDHNIEPLSEDKLETEELKPKKKQKLVSSKFTPFLPLISYKRLFKINRKLGIKNIRLKK